jgi:transposase-like protein
MSFTNDKMQKIGIKEMYLPIDDYSNYEVSNFGQVKNRKTGRILKPRLNRQGYEYVGLCDGINKPKLQQVHRLVLIAFEGISKNENQIFVDHIDNNKTNNCLFNLRWVSQQQNTFNRLMSKRNTSGIKGVSWCKRSNKWLAQIKSKGKNIHLGYFNNIEDAKLARQNKARELFGDYLNQCEM